MEVRVLSRALILSLLQVVIRGQSGSWEAFAEGSVIRTKMDPRGRCPSQFPVISLHLMGRIDLSHQSREGIGVDTK